MPANRPDLTKCGRVFWLAVMRNFQGRGLGRALLGAVCARMCDLGYERACVITSTGRLRALKLYLHTGFSPETTTSDEIRTWDKVLETIHRTGASMPTINTLSGAARSTPATPRQWPLRPG